MMRMEKGKGSKDTKDDELRVFGDVKIVSYNFQFSGLGPWVYGDVTNQDRESKSRRTLKEKAALVLDIMNVKNPEDARVQILRMY